MICTFSENLDTSCQVDIIFMLNFVNGIMPSFHSVDQSKKLLQVYHTCIAINEIEF